MKIFKIFFFLQIMKLVKRHKADDEVRENLKFGGKIITRFYIRHVSYTCMYLQSCYLV